MRIVAAEALTVGGWRKDVALDIGADGRISAISDQRISALSDERISALTDGTAAANAPDIRVDVLLPAPANLHSHAFQRAIAGLTEYSGAQTDDFWTWRERMYAFLDRLTPDDVEALALGVQMESLESGFAAIGEFHYVHNAPDGTAYDNPGELCARIVAAAERTGIGLTLLPVLYQVGGLDGRALTGGQRRFGASLDAFAAIHASAETTMAAALGPDARLGIAPHSLRAVPPDVFAELGGFQGPRHIHVAEQVREVEEVTSATGLTPVARLMDLAAVDERWTLIHATHASANELSRLAATGATVGLCPVTEANLGDGVCAVPALRQANGAFGVGSDSNVRVSLVEELRLLDYAQRLTLRRRNPHASEAASSGRALLEAAAAGGARSLARDAGVIATGRLADLVALDGSAVALAGLTGDRILDAWLFAGDGSEVCEVWSAGRHVVHGGRHVAREAIAPRFHACLRRLREAP